VNQVIDIWYKKHKYVIGILGTKFSKVDPTILSDLGLNSEFSGFGWGSVGIDVCFISIWKSLWISDTSSSESLMENLSLTTLIVLFPTSTFFSSGNIHSFSSSPWQLLSSSDSIAFIKVSNSLELEDCRMFGLFDLHEE
jgi:hypothetical protein